MKLPVSFLCAASLSLSSMAACPQPGMWQPLWQDGLAVHVSKMLNPRATDKEMLLDFPAGSLALPPVQRASVTLTP